MILYDTVSYLDMPSISSLRSSLSEGVLYLLAVALREAEEGEGREEWQSVLVGYGSSLGRPDFTDRYISWM